MYVYVCMCFWVKDLKGRVKLPSSLYAIFLTGLPFVRCNFVIIYNILQKFKPMCVATFSVLWSTEEENEVLSLNFSILAFKTGLDYEPENSLIFFTYTHVYSIYMYDAVAWVREWTIPTERPLLVGKVGASIWRIQGATWSTWRFPTAVLSPFETEIYMVNSIIYTYISSLFFPWLIRPYN
jgi:hypothetical protein